MNESPGATIRYSPHVQFLPKDPQPYLQVTSSPIPLSIGAGYKVYAVRCSDKKELEITPHVILSKLGTQLLLKFVYLPYDFGPMPVYLKIDRYGDGVKKYYSNKFLITGHNRHLTARIDYTDNENRIPFPVGITRVNAQQFQSARLRFYFSDIVDATDVDVYYQITRSQSINSRISIKEYNKWRTQPMNHWTLTRLARALYKGHCYIDQVRNYIVEGLERNEREGQSNISENEFLTDPDNSDTIDILQEIIGDGWQRVPFLSSSPQRSSTAFLSSQSQISIPIP